MKNKNFISFQVFGMTNSVIICRHNIRVIMPDATNQLNSNIYLDDDKGPIKVDEPTSSIEGRL